MPFPPEINVVAQPKINLGIDSPATLGESFMMPVKSLGGTVNLQQVPGGILKSEIAADK